MHDAYVCVFYDKADQLVALQILEQTEEQKITQDSNFIEPCEMSYRLYHDKVERERKKALERIDAKIKVEGRSR